MIDQKSYQWIKLFSLKILGQKLYENRTSEKEKFSMSVNSFTKYKSESLLQFVGSERTITADLKDSVVKDVVWKGPPTEQQGYKCFYFTDGIGIQAPLKLMRGQEYFFRAWWVYEGDKVEIYENIARLVNGNFISLRSGVYTRDESKGESANSLKQY